MAFTDIFIPGRIKLNLTSDLSALKEIAYRQSKSAGLSQQRTALWEACCDGAEDLIAQLFVKNQTKQLDWDLKKRRRKLNRPRLQTIYGWMLLYQLVLLRNRGLNGYDKDQEFRSLRQVAFDFMESLASSPENDTANASPNPGAWGSGWDRQVSLEAALDLYNSVMQVFGVYVDLEARIYRVSLFTSASERAYDSNIKEQMGLPGTGA